MAKVLKVAAVVVGVTALAFTGVGLAAGLGTAAASFGFGVSASTLFLASAGLSLGASLLTKRPAVPSSQSERLNATIDPRAFRKEVLGQTAFAVDVRYEEWSGADQDYCDWIVCFASHAVDGLEEIWLNDEMAWSQTTGVVGKFVGYFSIPNLVLEGSPANAFTFASGKWNGAHRLTGCAYARFRFKVTGNSKKAESPFSSGPTSRITAIGRGAKLYDPRRDSTVAGGSGPMRADDQSTWRFVADDGATIGENLPLLILRRLLGWRITNPVTGQLRLATGSGLPSKRIDMMSFIVAANQADELVNRSAGGTEPRYHGAGVVSEGDDTRTTLDALCAACCGRFRDTGGKLALVIPHNDLADAAADDGLDADDVIGAFSWDPDPALEQAPNVIRGRYVDGSAESLYQLIDYPEVRIPSPDGIDRVFTLDLGYVESVSQAQRIAKQVLQRKQYERRFVAPFDIRAWGWPVGKPVPFTFPPLGFDRTLFRVAEQDIGTGSSCQMVLEGESADIYAWDADDRAPVHAAAAISYDPTKAAIVQAIGDVEQSSLQLTIRNSFIVEVTAGIGIVAAAADGTVTIANHTRRYTDRDVAVMGGTIATGLPPGGSISIAYDDPARTGGAVTYFTVEDDADAFASAAHPARHYVGYVDIPQTGTSTGGGGGAPGGRGGACVVDDAPWLMANDTHDGPGAQKPGSAVTSADWVWTQHEVTRAWGAYPVEEVSFQEADVFAANGLPRATGEHQFDRGGWWKKAKGLGVPAGRARVVKATIADARTYVTVQPDGSLVLNHNIKQTDQ